MGQQSTANVVPFKLPPLVQRLTPGDIVERLDAVKGEDCLLSYYGVRDQSLVMFRLDGKGLDWWFAQGPMSRANALEVVQRESLAERVPQSRNYFFEIRPPDNGE